MAASRTDRYIGLSGFRDHHGPSTWLLGSADSVRISSDSASKSDTTSEVVKVPVYPVILVGLRWLKVGDTCRPEVLWRSRAPANRSSRAATAWDPVASWARTV